VLERLTGRRSCPTCGRIYNIHTQLPRQDELCDVDSSKLVMRNDDSKEVIAERLKTYDRQTRPLLKYYRSQGRLIEVNGDLDVESVTAQIMDVLERSGRVAVSTGSRK
jgi:adenylate kinase